MSEEILQRILDFNAEVERLLIEIEFKKFYDIYCVTLRKELLSRDLKKPDSVYSVYYIEIANELIDLNKIKKEYELRNLLEENLSKNKTNDIELESYKKKDVFKNTQIDSFVSQNNTIEKKPDLSLYRKNNEDLFSYQKFQEIKPINNKNKIVLLLYQNINKKIDTINTQKIEDFKRKKFKYIIPLALERIKVKSDNLVNKIDIRKMSLKFEDKKIGFSIKSFLKKDIKTYSELISIPIKENKHKFTLVRPFLKKEKATNLDLLKPLFKFFKLTNDLDISKTSKKIKDLVKYNFELESFSYLQNKNLLKPVKLGRVEKKFSPINNLVKYWNNLINYKNIYLLEKNRDVLLISLFSKLKDIVKLNNNYKINLLVESRYRLLKYNYNIQINSLYNNINNLINRNNNIKIDYRIYNNILLDLLLYNIIILENIMEIRNNIINKLINYNKQDKKTLDEYSIVKILIEKNKDIIYSLTSKINNLLEYNQISLDELKSYIDILLNYNDINPENIQSNIEENISRNNGDMEGVISNLENLISQNQFSNINFDFNKIYARLLELNYKPDINLSNYKEQKNKLLSFISFLLTNPSLILLFEKIIKNSLLKRNKLDYYKVEDYGFAYDRSIYANEKYVQGIENFDNKQKRFQEFIKKLSENEKSTNIADSFLKEEEKSLVYQYRVEKKTSYELQKIENTKNKQNNSNIIIINNISSNKNTGLPSNLFLIESLINSHKNIENFIVITNYSVLNTNRNLKIWTPGKAESDITHTVCFAPFLKDVSLSFNASFNSYNFLGRVEPYYTYSNSNADGSIGFYIFAGKEKNTNELIEFPINNSLIVERSETMETLKKKIEFLIRLTRPSSNYDTSSSFSFVYPPICHIKIGDYVNHDVVINSVSLGNIDNNILWGSYKDKNKEKFFPIGFSVDIRFNIYGQYTEDYDKFISTGKFNTLKNYSVTSDDKKNFFFDV